MLFHVELKNVLRSFKDAGIEVMVLKGAAIAEEVLGNVALREMSDIDLLVRENDLERADAKLTELGYSWNEGYRPKDWYRHNHHHLAPRYHPVKRIIVEIHHNLVISNGLFRLDSAKLWEKARIINVEDLETKALSTENTLIHFCLHFSYFEALVGNIRAVSDLCRLIEFYDESIDWDWIIREARKGDFARFIYYPLFLTNELLTIKINGHVLDSLKRASRMGWVADHILKMAARRTILEQDDSANIIPRWLIRRLCRQILKHDNSFRTWAFFVKSILSQNSETTQELSRDDLLRTKYSYHPARLLLRFFLRLGRITVKGISHRVGMIFAR